MRRAASLAASVLLASLLAGCGGSSPPKSDPAVDVFFASTAKGRAFGKRFPHRPGSLPCKVFDRQLRQQVDATCGTDVSHDPNRVVVTLTESWSHGSRTHTWFVFLRPDGTIQSIRQEGVAPSG